MVCLYVDDLLVTGSKESEIHKFKEKMQLEFEMSDMGELSYFLGIEFLRTEKGVFMSQKKYALEVLKRFNLLDCNYVTTPVDCGIVLTKADTGKAVDSTMYKQIVGSLRYLCCSRPEISYGVGLVSRFMENPKESHFMAAKRILRYVKGTIDHGVLFPGRAYNLRSEMIGYVDADWCGDKDDKKSTTGFVFLCGDAPISWCSKKQPIVALSSCEAEYVAASFGACQAVWLSMLLEEIGLKSSRVMKLLIDNKPAIDLAKYPVAHGRSKHIETRFHFLRDQVSRGKLELEHFPIEEQLADLFTKPFKAERFSLLCKKLKILSLSSILI
ncbi:uncharacterized mitochondrial protein AtMg00810-like [Lotus japonicus]|uniref:uncharacterized mitochondrial protein AtMg00810-like n=1 Tax=Lotus japonicus TaxID=34305 RepID=UPI002583DE2E|nr:uncharacterized mitochondrial protein AtMg00810-like [Lotus japonicus]